MTITQIDFRFTEPELAEALTKAPPPEGVKIIAQPPQINASEGASMVFRVIAKFSNPISIDAEIRVPASLVLVALSAWTAKHLKNKVKYRKDKKATVNNDVITLNKKDVLLIVQKEVGAQIARERQWAEHQESKNRK